MHQNRQAAHTFHNHFILKKNHKNTLEDNKPLSGDEVDVMPQRRVVFGQLLRWRVSPGKCRLGRICICARESPRQQAESQQRCSGGVAPGITWKTRVNIRQTLSQDTNPMCKEFGSKVFSPNITNSNQTMNKNTNIII